MVLVVGLGNPGADYASTRHNVGWWVLERLRERWKAAPAEKSQSYRVWQCEVAGRSVGLVAPQTYMNLSGEALQEWRTAHPEMEIEDLLVIADDVYLPVGRLRLRAAGSSGGHRGLESIEATLGTRDYTRLRIGVGETSSAELKRHVLEAPSDKEAAVLEEAADRAADAVECWVKEGLGPAMNRFNGQEPKEVSES